jgi:hypothetical protein
MARAPELIADHGLSGMTGVDFLARADAMYPLAKRVLLVERDTQWLPGTVQLKWSRSALCRAALSAGLA